MTALNPNVVALAVLFSVALVLVAIMYLAATYLGPKRFNATKLQPFECGMTPVGSPREGGLRLRFYVVAILFVVFDIEVIFLFPWAVSYAELGLFGLVEILVFVGALGIGLFYVLRKGVVAWS
ncbi:MAG: NADH-quinone oxidoreductase subunit A [bacterium]|jgi:NADH-quinone oxidoreductase subunit A|nr:NADH-quinone oxidoreductase subunit A [bacterium]